MRCIVCDQNDWKNVDEYRHAKKGMSICKNCGFVSYPELYKTEDEIREFYRKDYRPPPTINNLYTGYRKLNYHNKHLSPLFEKWADDGKTEPKVFEVGAAYGMLLDWIKRRIPGAEVGGTELTESFKRVAKHEYNLDLVDDIDLTQKYDLIISYKVAEHQMDADKRLREYAEALTDDGYLYVSVPCWFKRMTNFGVPGFDIEYYYDTSHINVWTQKLFETVLKKAGLQICYHDGVTYDDTYICKRNDALMDEAPEYENPDGIELIMENIKKATLAYENGDIDGAIDAFPDFPDAWFARYEKYRAESHRDQQKVSFEDLGKKFIDPMMEATGNSFEAYRFAGDLAMRYNHYGFATEMLGECDKMRPGQGAVLLPLSHCYREMAKAEKDPKKKMALQKNAMSLCVHISQVDLQSRGEATSWIYFDQAQIPVS